MTTYRFNRRAFMRGVGGATGLHALLRLSEARAAGEPAPKRFVVVFHPVGGVTRTGPARDPIRASRCRPLLRSSR